MKKLILTALFIGCAVLADQIFLPDGLRPRTEFIGSDLSGGKLILKYKRTTPSNLVYATYPASPAPDKIEIWEDVYCSSNGSVVLEKTLPGTYTPSTTQTSPEKYERPTNQ